MHTISKSAGITTKKMTSGAAAHRLAKGKLMIRVETPCDQVNVAKVYEVGQDQLFDYWDSLDSSEQHNLLSQLESIDFRNFSKLLKSKLHNEDQNPSFEQLTPVSMIELPKNSSDLAKRKEAERIGMESMANGEVGVFLVAGGQGTRLRFDGPKGIFPIGPVSQKSLFQLLAEQILAMQRRLKRAIPWYIMTSEANDAPTQEFFKENSYFGLNPSDIRFIPQGMLPIVEKRKGKILLESPSSIAMSPNGHGGSVAVIRSLKEDLKKRGIKYLFYHQVDNPLLSICDAAFLGYHIQNSSQFSSKAISKAYAGERMGVLCNDGGKMTVVEYTEMDDTHREQLDEDGKLSFRAGNSANHVISVDFLCPDDDTTAFEMPYHIAVKSTPYYEDGELIEPNEANSIKFESFLFDVLHFAENPLVVEGAREQEFAPVKNFEGQDSAATCQLALQEMWASWLKEAGVELERDADSKLKIKLEISSLYALDAEELKEKLSSKELEISNPLYLE